MLKRFFDELGRLFAEQDPPDAASGQVAREALPVRGIRAGLEVMRPRVLLLIFNPIIEAEGGVRLQRLLGWNDANTLARQYAARA